MQRTGIGFDAHAFAAGRALILGGVTIPYGRGLAGHSDADALLHAIVDALLGAAALGDIGGMFPSSDARWANASSLDLLRIAMASVREAGYAVENLDATVIAQEPPIAPHVGAMRKAIGGALGIDINVVSVKATTSDGLGFAGRGEGIAALASVLLHSTERERT